MSRQKKEPKGCGCAAIPLWLILVLLGGGYWLFTQRDNIDLGQFLPNDLYAKIPILNAPTPEPSLATPTTTPTHISLPTPDLAPAPTPSPLPTPVNTAATPQTPWQKKAIRGIYLSRYQVTNNASEKMIRDRVRYYKAQGFNTIIHGVWGNACTMYKSEVMQKTLGYQSCPNQFQDQWLDWLIDEAHKQEMEVHAYFEKGIKIDENSPVFDLAVEKGWIVAGVDRTHPGIDHYVLDVEIPEVANFFTNILVEFVEKYPTIDAVQWDDYLGYHAELPGKVDRTAKLTTFVQQMISSMKKANSAVSFDICHHNPYWAKRYFAADWANWDVDRVFIQVYSEENFKEEMKYVKQHDGIAITERQFNHLEALNKNDQIKSILLFPLSGKPEETAAKLHQLTTD
jgi:uncharacterized lipoprotein YddW (UPF0748 family)